VVTMGCAATFVRILTAVVLMSAATVPAPAGDAAPAPSLTLELNALQPSEKGCRLTFVVTNALGGEVARAAYEIALFDQAGVVDRLTVLDFKELPQGKTKVARFDLSGTDCTKVSRVLVNHATECSGTDLEPTACTRQLKTQTKAGIMFGL
jgi:hypothetical protein